MRCCIYEHVSVFVVVAVLTTTPYQQHNQARALLFSFRGAKTLKRAFSVQFAQTVDHINYPITCAAPATCDVSLCEQLKRYGLGAKPTGTKRKQTNNILRRFWV